MYKSPNKMTLAERLSAPTPRAFRWIRNIALILSAVGGTLLSAPVELPTIFAEIGGYLLTAGAVGSAVSQATVDDEEGI